MGMEFCCFYFYFLLEFTPFYLDIKPFCAKSTNRKKVLLDLCLCES